MAQETNGALLALGVVGAVAAAGKAMRKQSGSRSGKSGASAYYGEEGTIGEGRYIVGVFNGEAVGQIEVFRSTRALTDFVEQEYSTTFKGLGKGPGGYLSGIEIDEQIRGRGIGRRVVEKMIEVARDNGLKYIVLLSENEPYSFWRKLGFEDAETGDDDDFGFTHYTMHPMILRLVKVVR